MLPFEIPAGVALVLIVVGLAVLAGAVWVMLGRGDDHRKGGGRGPGGRGDGS